MDSLELKRRGRDDAAAAAATETEKKEANDIGKQRQKKKATAKRGLRSLAIAVLAPTLMTLFTAYFLGSGIGYGYAGEARPSWVPPPWALHATCMGSSFLMGLASWLVWVDGGFHRRTSALYLYSAQILLGLAWDPMAFCVGSWWAGLAVCLAQTAALFGCYKTFKQINPISGDLVKPCLVWAAFMAALNLKLSAF